MDSGLTVAALTELKIREKVLYEAVNFLNDWKTQTKKKKLVNTSQTKKKKLVNTFFQLLTQRKKTAARKTLERIKQNGETSQWQGGYINALDGMITASVKSSNRSAFINQINIERCDDLNKMFLKQSENILLTDFDKGYFTAWANYMQMLKPTVKTEQTIFH